MIGPPSENRRLNLFLRRCKGWLRPLVSAIRRQLKPRVFRVRHWRPSPRLNSTRPPENGAVKFELLWRTSPAKHTFISLDSKFTASIDYPTADNTLLHLINVYTHTKNKYLCIAHCPSTGVVFHHLLPPVSWQNRYYASEWDKAEGNAEAVPPGELVRGTTNKVQRIVGAHLPRKANVLDVGCGYGDQLFFFKQCGHEVFGIEPSQHRAEYATRLLCTEVFNCAIEEDLVRDQLRTAGRSFDLIYLNHVLEHLRNPLAVLRLLREFLTRNGILLIGVPDLFFESLGTYICSIVHTHYFSANALQNIAQLAGFKIKADLSFPGYLYFVFEIQEGCSRSLADPLTAKVVDYVCSHFDLASGRLRPGSIISILSEYTGHTETGLRAVSVPRAIQWRKVRRACTEGDMEGLRDVLPISITMPFEKPSIWMK